MRRLLLAACLWVTGCAFVRSNGGGPPMHADNPPGSWVVVAAGDTPASIAARAGIPVEDVLEINGLSRGQKLAPGTIVYVLEPIWKRPASTSSPTPRSSSTPGLVSSARLRWPLGEPKVTSLFGERNGRPHEGIDLASPIGTPIYAAAAGEVLYAGDAVRGYGNMIVLQHEGDLLTVYAHNSVLLVRGGDRVKAGDEIARVGQSGRATAPHLHFEVREQQSPRDPLLYLPVLGR